MKYECGIAKYEVSISYGLKVIVQIKVEQKDKHTDRQDKNNMPLVSCWGHKSTQYFFSSDVIFNMCIKSILDNSKISKMFTSHNFTIILHQLIILF